MYGFIYCVENIINGKKYVGKRVVKNNIKDNSYLGSGLIIKNAIKKYGIDNFHREILCECDNKEELEENEIYYIGVLNTTYPNGYNISKTSSLFLSKNEDGIHLMQYLID